MVRLLGKDGPDWDSLEDPCAKADNDILELTSGRCEGYKVQSIDPKWVSGVVVDKPHSFEWNCNEDNCWRKKFLHSEHRVRTGTSHWYSGSLDVQEALQIREGSGLCMTRGEISGYSLMERIEERILHMAKPCRRVHQTLE